MINILLVSMPIIFFKITNAMTLQVLLRTQKMKVSVSYSFWKKAVSENPHKGMIKKQKLSVRLYFAVK